MGLLLGVLIQDVLSKSILILGIMFPTMSLAAPTLPSWVIEMGGENHGHSHDGPELIGRGYFGVDAEDMFTVPTQAPEAATVASNSWGAYGTPTNGASSAGYGYGASSYGLQAQDMGMEHQDMAMEHLAMEPPD